MDEWRPGVPDDVASAAADTGVDAGPSACDCRTVLGSLAECRTAMASLSREERLAVLCTLAGELGLSVIPDESADAAGTPPLVSADQLNWAKEFVSQVVLSDALIGAALRLDESKQEIDGIAERLAHVAERPLGRPDTQWVHHGRLFERTAAGVFACDLDGRFLDINAAGLRLLGHSSIDALAAAHTFESLVIDRAAWHAFRTALYADHVVRGVECELVRSAGEPVRVFLTAVLVHSRDGTPVGFEGVWVHMTDEHEHQENLTGAQRIEAVQSAIGALRRRIAGPLEALCDATRLLIQRCETAGPYAELALAVSDEAAKLAEVLIAAADPAPPGPSSV